MNNSRPSVILKYFRTKFVVGWLVSFLLFLSLGNRITFEGRKFFEISLATPKTHSTWKWSESRSVMSHSLPSHGLYSTWNSPGQNTGVFSLSLLQWVFPNQESNRGLPHGRRILYQLSNQGSSKIHAT